MKIVKEHINEIKRDIKGSGLTSIGVGHVTMYKAYEECLKLHPGLDRILPMDSNYWNWQGALKKYPSIMANVLSTSPDKLISILSYKISLEAQEYLITQCKPDKTDKFYLTWGKTDTSAITPMIIQTDNNKGVSHVKYTDPQGIKVGYYVFRTP